MAPSNVNSNFKTFFLCTQSSQLRQGEKGRGKNYFTTDGISTGEKTLDNSSSFQQSNTGAWDLSTSLSFISEKNTKIYFQLRKVYSCFFSEKKKKTRTHNWNGQPRQIFPIIYSKPWVCLFVSFLSLSLFMCIAIYH